MQLQKSGFKYDMRKFYIANRVVDHWNSLPNWVVTANNIKLFKTDLISIGNIYDFRAQIPELEVTVVLRVL